MANAQNAKLQEVVEQLRSFYEDDDITYALKQVTDPTDIKLQIQLGKKQNIKGLEQAVMRIKVGSVIKLWIPSKLAYGARGAGSLIPPNTDLTFQLHLHRIVKQ